MKKFLIAIVVSIISGVVVWYLTGPGVKRVIPPETKPEIEIINLQHSKNPDLKPLENYKIKATVYNSGNEVAKQVKACLDIYGWTEEPIIESSELVKIEKDGKIKRLLDFMVCSEEIALLPGQSRELVLNCSINKEGNYYGAVRAFSYINDITTWYEEVVILGVWN